MATLALDLTKSIDENAAVYFERAKKIKKKIEGAKTALDENLQKLRQLEQKKEIHDLFTPIFEELERQGFSKNDLGA